MHSLQRKGVDRKRDSSPEKGTIGFQKTPEVRKELLNQINTKPFSSFKKQKLLESAAAADGRIEEADDKLEYEENFSDISEGAIEGKL